MRPEKFPNPVYLLDGAVLRFDLSDCFHLRVFEFRFEFSTYIFHDLVLWFASVIDTITSPVFSRFILVADSANFNQLFRKIDAYGKSGWEFADQALLRLSQRTGMKMVVKRRVLHETFRNVMRGTFPLMVSAGAFEFEYNDSPSCIDCPFCD